jgi:hypothetical protein
MSEIHSATADASDIPASTPEKRRPGRPRGSRNRVTNEQRTLIARHGPKTINAMARTGHASIAATTALHAIAEGKPPIEGGDAPSIGQVLDAHRVIREYQEGIVGRLVPLLKAIETTGADGEPLFSPEEPASNRDLAKAILATLSRGVAGGSKTTVEEPRHAHSKI